MVTVVMLFHFITSILQGFYHGIKDTNWHMEFSYFKATGLLINLKMLASVENRDT